MQDEISNDEEGQMLYEDISSDKEEQIIYTSNHTQEDYATATTYQGCDFYGEENDSVEDRESCTD